MNGTRTRVAQGFCLFVFRNPETIRYGVITKEKADMYILEVHHHI